MADKIYNYPPPGTKVVCILKEDSAWLPGDIGYVIKHDQYEVSVSKIKDDRLNAITYYASRLEGPQTHSKMFKVVSKKPTIIIGD